MTPAERKAKLDEFAAPLWGIRSELERLRRELSFEVDRKAAAHIITSLGWAVENCTVIGKHQIGEAMDDAMGVTADGVVR